MAKAMMQGQRLAYVVVPLTNPDGTDMIVQRPVISLIPREIGKTALGVKKFTYERKVKLADEPAGYMVYFPRGHCLRLRTMKDLRRYKLDKPPSPVNLGNIPMDKNHPLHKLVMAQNESDRRGAMTLLEEAVIKMATAKTGPNVLTIEADVPEYLKEAA